MNQEKTVFICEDSTEGIFTAVYDGWMEAKKVQIQIRTCEPENMELFTRLHHVQSGQRESRAGNENYSEESGICRLPGFVVCSSLFGSGSWNCGFLYSL